MWDGKRLKDGRNNDNDDPFVFPCLPETHKIISKYVRGIMVTNLAEIMEDF